MLDINQATIRNWVEGALDAYWGASPVEGGRASVGAGVEPDRAPGVRAPASCVDESEDLMIDAASAQLDVPQIAGG